MQNERLWLSGWKYLTRRDLTVFIGLHLLAVLALSIGVVVFTLEKQKYLDGLPAGLGPAVGIGSMLSAFFIAFTLLADWMENIWEVMKTRKDPDYSGLFANTVFVRLAVGKLIITSI
jgi:hypothetical protein